LPRGKSDQLIIHFVNEARDAGLSWTQIGERMGVTKQAARKRFVPRDIPDEHSVLRERIYGRYTAPARRPEYARNGPRRCPTDR
jgi:hypothetical protein